MSTQIASPAALITIPDTHSINLPPNIPQGWAIDTFADLANCAEAEDLVGYKEHLDRWASYIASLRDDQLEVEKALRIVEFRSGVLLGDPQPGRRTDLEPITSVLEVSPMTASRYRKIARFWDVVWPHLITAKDPREVTQAAVLRLIDEHVKKEVGPSAPKRAAAGPTLVTDDDTDLPFPEVDAERLFTQQTSDAASTDLLSPLEDEIAGIATEVERLEEMLGEAADPYVEWQREAELRAQVEAERDSYKAALEADERGREVVRLNEKLASAEHKFQQALGRLQQQTNTLNAAEKRAKWAIGELAKLQKLLGVETYGEIVGAVQELKR